MSSLDILIVVAPNLVRVYDRNDRIVVMISLLPTFLWNKLRPSRPLDSPCGVPRHPLSLWGGASSPGWSVITWHAHVLGAIVFIHLTPFLYEFLSLKSKEHSLGITFGNIWSIQKYLNNCAIKHKLEVPYASFEENCAQTRTFSSTPFSMGGNHFLVHGRETGITSFFKLFLDKYFLIQKSVL